MALSPADMTELKRIATNAHADDKARWNRIIMEISALVTRVKFLEKENDNLQKLINEKGL